jgi:hypothetical protein
MRWPDQQRVDEARRREPIARGYRVIVVRGNKDFEAMVTPPPRCISRQGVGRLTANGRRGRRGEPNGSRWDRKEPRSPTSLSILGFHRCRERTE